MPNAILKFNERELKIGEDVTTIGRTTDNTVSFSNDSNISRYHAEIERRGEDYYLIELGSSNGTTINGATVDGEKLLNDGDIITLGNSSVVEFNFEKDEIEEKAETASIGDAASGGAGATVSNEAETAKDAGTTNKFPVMLAVAGAACGLAVVFVVAAVLYSYTSAKPCEAKAIITKPDNFETLNDATEITVETADETECARRAIFLLDGAEFASADAQPYGTTLDPNDRPTLADGMNHSLKVVLEDADGNKMVQQGEVLLVFETKAIEAPTPTPGETTETPTPTPKTTKGKVTLIEIQTMSDNLTKSLGNYRYKLSKEFLEEVQKKTADYASAEGYFARAQTFQDAIKVAYIQEYGLRSSLGFVLAMSRSKFNPQKQGANESLWQISNDFAAANSLTQPCGTETLSDASQNCAAKASALYLKSILVTVFDEDAIYTVAAFGMSPTEASQWKQTLPADRSDIWKVLKSPQRDAVTSFFAAGIVAENPQKFGLKKDLPISQLY
ncbi:MAG: FHA domain-containing protein [Pyrinomonadaceae bacterium]